jgi:hypothetical protein
MRQLKVPKGRFGSVASVERCRYVGFTSDSGHMAATQRTDSAGQRRTLIDGNAVIARPRRATVVCALLVEGSTFRSELRPSGRLFAYPGLFGRANIFPARARQPDAAKRGMRAASRIDWHNEENAKRPWCDPRHFLWKRAY